jgi:hypothetical protein
MLLGSENASLRPTRSTKLCRLWFYCTTAVKTRIEMVPACLALRRFEKSLQTACSLP